MSIFEAEVRDKAGEEDILTSDVFGALETVDRNVLGSILEKLEISVSSEELENVKFRFWEKYNEDDKREPDVIIETDSFLIFVESKLDSPVSLVQLKEEYEDGSKHSKNFYLVCATDHFREPMEIGQLKADSSVEAGRIKWTSWREVYGEVQKIMKKVELDKVSERAVRGLSRLLEKKGFRGFEGLKKEALVQIVNSQKAFSSFYDDIPTLIGELSARLERYNVEHKTKKGTYFYRDGRGTRFDWPGDWIHTFCTFAFLDKNWDVGSLEYNASSYLFLRFYLDREEDPVWVGYGFGPYFIDEGKWYKAELTDEQKKAVSEYLSSKTDMYVASPNWCHQSDAEFIIKATEVKPEHLEYKDYRIEFFYKIPLEMISEQKLIEKLVQKLKSLRDMVNELDLLPKKTEIVSEEEVEEAEGKVEEEE